MAITDRLATALAGRYQIERHVGSGGMASVYLAEDLKHKRKVALKVLKPELAAVLGAERFVQEITTTASLQHPHILPLFDSGEADGFLYYVMPFIDGETLRDRLNRETQLGVDEAVRIATDVADALDYAHRHNVIHRDIKPENILLHDGRPVIADFGIALAVSAAAGGRLTETGLSLGTPHYMSPEQATAEKDLTGRSDIYSLGAVLYEMLAGEPPHLGNSAQQIIMKIVTDEARPVTDLRKSVPANVAVALGRALEKLPADRFETAKAFAEALATGPTIWPPRGVVRTPAAKTAATRVPAAVTYAVVLAVGIALGVWLAPRSPGLAAYDVGLPDSAQIAFTKGDPYGTGWTAFAVAPNGEFVVYIADVDTTTMLWYRSLVDDAMRPIAGTEGAYQLFLSPDGNEVAFLAGDRLRKVALDAAGIFNVIQTESPYGGEWLRDGTLLLSDSNGGTLNSIDLATGATSTVRIGEGITERGCYLPHVVPEATGVLCSDGTYGQIRLAKLDDGTAVDVRYRADLGSASANAPVFGSSPRVVEGRYLLYLSPEGYLYAAPIDLKTLTLGRQTVVLRGVRREGLAGAGQYALTARGTLVYAPGRNVGAGDFVRTRGVGSPERLPIPRAVAMQFDITRDGRRFAVVLQAVTGQELWSYDLETGHGERLVLAYSVSEPRWSPTGDELLFQLQSRRDDSVTTVLMHPRQPDRFDTLSIPLIPSQYFAENRLVGVLSGRANLAIFVMDPTVAPPRIDTLEFSDAGATRPALSPDGRWIAYMLRGGGRDGVYIERYPRSGPRYKISTESGLDPLWLSPTEVTYRAGFTWYKVRVTGEGRTPHSPPQRWFEDPLFIDTWERSQVQTADGGMIYLRATGGNTGAYLRVVPNWVKQMKRMVDGG